MRDSIDPSISPSKATSLAAQAAAAGVPRSTFGHRSRGRPERSEGHRKQMLLSPEEEEALVASVERLCEWNWAPPMPAIRAMAESLLAERPDPPRHNVGVNWVPRFLERHKALKATWSEALESSRASASKPELISRFLEKLLALMIRYGISAEDIWNFDEKGVQAGGVHRCRLVLQRMFASFDKRRRTPGDRANLTLIECASAAGSCLPPLIILAATETQVDWARDNSVPKGKCILISTNMLIWL